MDFQGNNGPKRNTSSSIDYYYYYCCNNNSSNDNNIRLKFPPPPFLQCTRTGNGDWRCQSMVAPGRSYCSKHYKEQKIRNERKRHRKMAALAKPRLPTPTSTPISFRIPRFQPVPVSSSGSESGSSGGGGSGGGSGRIKKMSRIVNRDRSHQIQPKPQNVINNVSEGLRIRKRKRGLTSDDDHDHRPEAEEEQEEEVSEMDFFTKRILPRGFRFDDQDGNWKKLHHSNIIDKKKTEMGTDSVSKGVRDYYRTKKITRQPSQGIAAISAKTKRTSAGEKNNNSSSNDSITRDLGIANATLEPQILKIRGRLLFMKGRMI